MEDGSSVRIKVAQYFVNKKHEELKVKNLAIKTDDLTYLQALPPFLEAGDDVESPESASSGESLPPPLFPPGKQYSQWDELLKFAPLPDLPSGDDGPDRVPGHPPWWPTWPPWYRVAIIGAGVAGLRTAKLLQNLGIPYKIFEASDRPGGRVFTYDFTAKTPGNPGGKHDYYDVGAMRFPNNKANAITFRLFKELGLSNKLIDYVLSRDNNVRYFNSECLASNMHQGLSAARFCTYSLSFLVLFQQLTRQKVQEAYLNKAYTDPWNRNSYGVNACTAEAFDPFRKGLIDNFDKGWKELMKYDWASTRSYLSQGKPQYPLPVIHWMETRNSGTGGYDAAFAESILSSLEFDDPMPPKVQWKCLEGGSKVLIDAMLKVLTTKPSYRQRVTSIEEVSVFPPDYFPDIPHWPRWPRQLLFPLMKVGVSGRPDEYFTHVVSTVSFAELNMIDTKKVPMTYKQRHAIRTLGYGPAVKVAIKFKSRWWERAGIDQKGGSSYTDRPSRVVVYPSYGIGESGPGVLMVTYNWQQDASRYGALIKNPDWSDKLDPDRVRPWSEKFLLDQIYADLAVLHGVDANWLRGETLDYHAFDWYHNPFTMGAYAHYAPGQFSTLFDSIVHSAAYGRFHFAGEVASHHHGWVAGALDSAVRVFREILRLDFPIFIRWLKEKEAREDLLSLVFSSEEHADEHYVKGLFSKEIEEAELLLDDAKQ